MVFLLLRSVMAQSSRPAAVLAQLILMAGIIGAAPASASSTMAPHRFYVSSSSGNDDSDGTGPTRPWRSLDRINHQIFKPGDQILLKAGDRFSGQLDISSSGSSAKPLIIGAYGKGARPIIDGASGIGGAFTSAILIKNQHDIAIRDLEITNAVGRLRSGESDVVAFGILVVNDGGGTLDRFDLSHLFIHDVFAKKIYHNSEDQFNRVNIAGIRFTSTVPQKGGIPSFFNNVRISGNEISRTGRFGVQLSDDGYFGKRNADARSRNPDTGFNQNIIIDNNRFSELGGSAVQLSGARYALIENNEFNHCGSKMVPDRMVGRGSGAWVINSRDVVAQHNRSLHTRGYKDSYGMHVDYGNLNILYQYNYSEDSEGGFIEILGDNKNIIWRYNISVNDGWRDVDGNSLWVSTWSPGKIRSDNISIYNNTIYVGPGKFPDLSFQAENIKIWNNIFAAAPGAAIGEKLKIDLQGQKLSLSRNLFFGAINGEFARLDNASRSGDPDFAAAGMTGPDSYRVRRGSPALDGVPHLLSSEFPAAGYGIFANISSTADQDFFGNPLRYDRLSIGADGGDGQTLPH